MKIHYGFAVDKWLVETKDKSETQVAVTLPMYYDVTNGRVPVDEAIEEVEEFIAQAQAALEQLKGMKK